jgi:hypothetical protein
METTFNSQLFAPTILAAYRNYSVKRQTGASIKNIMMSLLAAMTRSIEPGATVPLVEINEGSGVTYFEPTTNTICLASADKDSDQLLLQEYAYSFMGMNQVDASIWAEQLIASVKGA